MIKYKEINYKNLNLSHDKIFLYVLEERNKYPIKYIDYNNTIIYTIPHKEISWYTHREDGPAIIWHDGTLEWYYYGHSFPEEKDWLNLTTRKLIEIKTFI